MMDKRVRITGRILIGVLPFLMLFPNPGEAQFYTGSNQKFGKNRLQFREFLWRYYKFKDFKTYFYTGGEDLAEYTARRARYHIDDLQKLFDHKLQERIHFLIYNKHGHFKQSNIGIKHSGDYNIGGVTNIVGSKVSIFFEGDHHEIDQQIRSGVARILINQMMYGGGWKEVVKNSTLLTVPDWYVDGLVSYVSRDWDTDMDSRVRDGILSGRYERFNRLKGKDARLAGHAMWNYIAEVYGKSVIPEILYMTKSSRNVESGFLFVLGLSLEDLSRKYIQYYREKYRKDERYRSEPDLDSIPIEQEKRTVYYQFKLGPNGRYAAYVSNELGKYKVWLYDLEENEKDKIFKDGHKLRRIHDHSYPVLSWHPTGKALAFITEEKGDLYLNRYFTEEDELERKRLLGLDKVLDMDFASSGRKMVFSAVAEGQTDLYLYHMVGNRQEKLTNDRYDDLHPRFLDGDKRVIFSSNRPNDTLSKKNRPFANDKDIFIHSMNDSAEVLERITNTPGINETQPAPYDSVQYTFLSDRNGIRNRYLATRDSAVSYVDTTVHYRHFTETDPLSNFSRSIDEYQVNREQDRYALLLYMNGKHKFYTGKLSEDRILSSTNVRKTHFKKVHEQGSNAPADTLEGMTEQQWSERRDTMEVNIEHYQFGLPDSTTNQEKGSHEEKKAEQTEAKDPDSLRSILFGKDTTKSEHSRDSARKSFNMGTQRNYNVNFTIDQVTSRLDNTFLNTTYQKFDPGNPSFNNPGMNGLITLSTTDLFEDYTIMGGIRLSGNLNNNEYFARVMDYSKRLDEEYMFHRQSFLRVNELTATKSFVHALLYSVTWPLSEVASLRGDLRVRNDKEVTLSTEQQTLNEPDKNVNTAAIRGAYVFDNALPLGLNLREGFRMKYFGEYYQNVGDLESGDMFVVGLDTRHYFRIHRNLIWANRLAGSKSFGSRKLIYYLGGVDNWLTPDFNNSTRIAQDENFAFQTLGTPMRGFIQNARNGNSFALFNSEIRFPVFDYFTHQPIKSDFLKNFQIVGFGDIGTAWTGPDPYSEENAFNIQQINAPPLTITLQNQREPIVGGYGFGLRSRIWGYFVRADWAWGVDDGRILDSQFYLSLSLDF